VIVVGGGLIGLAVAAGAAARGASVCLVGQSRSGEASAAGAGMLAPGAESDELHGDAVVRFALAGRDLFPSYVAGILERTGIDVPLDRSGIIEIAPNGEPASRPPGSEWLDPRALHALEPTLAEGTGALLHPCDGSVDNVVLLQAMRRLVRSYDVVTIVAERARSLDVSGARPRVMLASGDSLESRCVVLAGGSWVGQLGGLPRPIPVRPVRGQMLSLGAAGLRHVTYGGGGYLVPRTGGRTLVGATMEDVGFDSATTPEGRSTLTDVAARLAPSLASAPLLSHWAGLRPITPDGLAILGPDPDVPALLYACGHGRNGILLAPITGESIGAMALGESVSLDLAPFAIGRFVEAA
jgi:glycine oxidase